MPEYRGLSMDVWKNAAVHGIKEPRESRGIDSAGMKFTELDDFLPAFADLCRASPYDFTHVALTLPLSFGGEVLGRMQTEHSGINFNPFVTVGHTDAERHYLGKDHLGSIRAVLNKWGSPLRTYDYDAFGNPLQDRPERHRLGFIGKEYDGWTGLYDYGFRDYSPVHGRFTTSDPIQDGYNWYAYSASDPVNWIDPWGLECPLNAQSGEDKKVSPLYNNANDERYSVYSTSVTDTKESDLDTYDKLNGYIGDVIGNTASTFEQYGKAFHTQGSSSQLPLPTLPNKHLLDTGKQLNKANKIFVGVALGFDVYDGYQVGQNTNSVGRGIYRGVTNVLSTLGGIAVGGLVTSAMTLSTFGSASIPGIAVGWATGTATSLVLTQAFSQIENLLFGVKDEKNRK